MKKVILSMLLAIVASAAAQQMQLPVIQFDMNDFMAHQQQQAQAQARDHPMPPPQPMHQHFDVREANQMQEEPMVGSPLIGGLFHPLHPLNPLGLKGLGGLPGLRFSNFQAGHLGGLHFGNALLGAGNPMEAEGEIQVGRKHHHKGHHFIEQELGSPQHFDHMPQQMEPQVGLPQEMQQGFIKGFGWPWLWVEDEVGAPQMYQAEPQGYNFGPEQQMPAQEFQVAAPPMQYQMEPMGPPAPMMFPMIPQHAEEQARTWGKGYSKGHDDYGYE